MRTPGIAATLALAALAASGCGPGPAPDALAPSTAWSAEDWTAFEDKVRWASAAGLDTLPIGDAVARLAISWVGTPYTPGTLEVEGPERLVVNFREFDCVTFVENVLATTWFVRNEGAEALARPAVARDAYERYLSELRYRDGILDGYPSRLHYFSEWLADNDDRGLVEIVTDGLEPTRDAEPIAFMSTHPEAYRQLADPDVLEAIRARERALNARGPRAYVPESRIESVAGGVASGDVIAATSTVRGLDIAHTGIAAWIDGELKLVHAPLVGRAVEISGSTLADRILRIESQDGIMVARPRERAPGTGSGRSP